MRIAQSIDQLLATLRASRMKAPGPSLLSGLGAIDSLLPGGGFAAGCVHEILSDRPSAILPLLIARAAAREGWVVWCDLLRQFYAPAAAAVGLPLDRLVVLRPLAQREQLWAAAESMRCAGVGACIVAVPSLSFLQARRLQLAAERGGGVGLVLRSTEAISRPYAAATRWIVNPIPGEKNLQRWNAQLIHGHGGRVGANVILEVCHETNHVRAISALAHSANPAQAASA